MATTLFIKVSEIADNPFQTRFNYPEEYIRELGESIDSQGLLQPVGVRKKGKTYQLGFGHCRLRAMKNLGKEKIECTVNAWTDEQMATICFTENQQRLDTNPMEDALAMENFRKTFNWTMEQVSEKLDVSPATVSNTIRLLKLPAYFRNAIAVGKLTAAQGKAIVFLYEKPRVMRDATLRCLTWTWPVEYDHKTSKITYKMLDWRDNHDEERLQLFFERSAPQLKRDIQTAIANVGVVVSGTMLFKEYPTSMSIVHDTCSGCKMLLQQEGEKPRCTFKSCLESKKDHTRKERFVNYVEKKDITILPDVPEGAVLFENSYRSGEVNKQTIKHAVNTGCPNLAIVKKAYTGLMSLPNPQIKAVSHGCLCTGHKGGCPCRDIFGTETSTGNLVSKEEAARQILKESVLEAFDVSVTANMLALFKDLAKKKDTAAMAFLITNSNLSGDKRPSSWDAFATQLLDELADDMNNHAWRKSYYSSSIVDMTYADIKVNTVAYYKEYFAYTTKKVSTPALKKLSTCLTAFHGALKKIKAEWDTAHKADDDATPDNE